MKAILFPICLIVLAQQAGAQKGRQGSTSPSKENVKFLEDISIEVSSTPAVYTTTNTSPQIQRQPDKQGHGPSVDIENFGPLQFKYALIMDSRVEDIQNLKLFEQIDSWYGTAYRMGGTDHEGIDCSAFTQTLYSAVYNRNLPRTSREQFDNSSPLERTDWKEGDLLFFNTGGGVSHVGFYLQGNKFVHASSKGVMISDLTEAYWTAHFLSAGRPFTPAAAAPAVLSTR